MGLDHSQSVRAALKRAGNFKLVLKIVLNLKIFFSILSPVHTLFLIVMCPSCQLIVITVFCEYC